MMNRDVTKAKEDGSSSVVGDEANPRIIEKPVGPGTDQSARDANESEDNAVEKGKRKNQEAGDKGDEEKEAGDEGEKEKEPGDEIEPRRNDEEADERAIMLFGRHHETESHADSISVEN
ncbi:Uncharacterized protein Rs2_41033 [Raphanus sativus]|nr:Uncharacterized protein Rs2_41033 [Raphanus sativus]